MWEETFKQYDESFKENNWQIPTYIIDYWNGNEESDEDDNSNDDCIQNNNINDGEDFHYNFYYENKLEC